MILIDRRTGSSGYLAPLRALGSASELAGVDLPADVQWDGHGPDQTTFLIGIELKTIQDLLQGLRDGRLAGQQIGPLIQNYDVRYLVITGWWRPSEKGFIETGRATEEIEPREYISITTVRWRLAEGCHRYDAILHAIETICQHANVIPVFLDTKEETTLWLKITHDWWQKPWDSHRTSERLYVTPIPYTAREAAARSTQSLTGKPRWQGKSTIIEAWLHALPHMGRKAVTLAPNFKTPAAIVYQQDWRDFEGIGKKSAQDIRQAIHGNEDSLA